MYLHWVCLLTSFNKLWIHEVFNKCLVSLNTSVSGPMSSPSPSGGKQTSRDHTRVSLWDELLSPSSGTTLMRSPLLSSVGRKGFFP